jgi:SAM-dependent methyltransferase
MIYDSLNLPVLQEIPRSAARILDLGCGVGTLGAAVKERQPVEVTGVTFSMEEAKLAREKLDHVLVENLNSFNPAALGGFHAIICSHVLEHLTAPEALLRACRGCLKEGSVLIVALPNILFWKQRFAFLAGRFQYTEGGLMDRTHVRFFDWSSARKLLEESGYLIVRARAEGNFPFSRVAGRLGGSIDRLALGWFPGCFGYQFIFTARLR